MRRSRVRAAHVLRCAIYCADLVLWFSIGSTIVLAASEYRNVFTNLGHPLKGIFLGGGPFLTLLGFGMLAMALLNGLRLWVAYRAYLKFDGKWHGCGISDRCDPCNYCRRRVDVGARAMR